MRRSSPILPTTTGPVLIPIRTAKSSPRWRRSDSAYSAIARCMASAAATARTA
jgi:ribosomal protein L31E